MARWTEDNFDRLHAADPDLPQGLHDRAADNWRGLIAVANELGGRWPALAREAATKLSATVEDRSDGVLLLADLRELFDKHETDVLFTESIKRDLHGREDRPWPEFGDQGKPITAPKIAALLRPFGIRPGSVRIGPDTAKGYKRDDLAEAWRRYLADVPLQGVTPSQPAAHAGYGGFQSVTADDRVTDADGGFLALEAECDGSGPHA